MSIAVTILTYNRLDFLKEIVYSIKNQTLKPDEIIVVNNSSTDGTTEWLEEQEELTVITQPNVGSSGGQWRALKEAHNKGHEWIWTMDDDVVPEQNCLELLMNDRIEKKIRAPLRFLNTGKPFFNDVLTVNLTNPFKSIWSTVYSEDNLNEEYTDAVGITFEGPVIHRSVIEKIGLPEKDFFIYGDDTEYFVRAWKADFDIVVYRDAVLNRKLHYQSIPDEFNWKTYYMIRNIIAIDRLHGNHAVRWLRPFGYFIKWLGRIHRFKDIFTVIKASIAGWFYKSNW